MLRQEAQHFAHAKYRADSETGADWWPVQPRISPTSRRSTIEGAHLLGDETGTAGGAR